MTPTRVPALALLLLASCATAPEPKRSIPIAPPSSKPVAAKAAADTVQPAVLKERGRTLDVRPAQHQDSLRAHCEHAPFSPNCVPPPSGEEVVFGMPPAPVPPPVPPPPPTPWYVSIWRFVWPGAGAALKDSDPEEAARRDRPPKPNETKISDPNWQPDEPNAPRYRPCWYAGFGGSGSFRPEKAPSDWVHCRYRCGRYEVHLNDMRLPKPDPSRKLTAEELQEEFCTKWIKRAEDHARNFDDALRARGL